MNDAQLQERFAMTFDPESYRRVIAEKEVIIHCHHYNARIQKTLESASQIDGKAIIKSAAETIFSEQLRAAIQPGDAQETQWALASGLYRHLGYGALDFSQRDAGVVVANASHFVEGWSAHFRERKQPVCTFTEGYIQGVFHALLGQVVNVREEACMLEGHEQCRFVLDPTRTHPHEPQNKKPRVFIQNNPPEGFVTSPHIDEQAIIDALVEMPIWGNQEGLIPAFGVYLANTPADFYNQICIRFVEEMGKHGLASSAKKLLIYDAENCGMNTFRGIMHSAEWEGLVAPMIQEQSDRLHGVIAISNGLGWGNWHVKEHTPGHSLTMESLNGYESQGYCERREFSDKPQCLMLTGVAAGIMELLYSVGTIEDRFGTYNSQEEDCICCEQHSCTFAVEKLSTTPA